MSFGGASGDVRVLDVPHVAAAERTAAVIAAGGHVALTGGQTPRIAYELLAAMELDWSGCTLWFGDERCVPPGDEQSNYWMVRRTLLDRLREPPRVRRMAGELGPREGAAVYERQLRDALGPGMPALDLVLLGLGADGHCASLFPDQEALEERERAVVGVERASLEPRVGRITLTVPALNAAREVVFLVAGAEKADAVVRALGPPSPATPASLVAPTSGTLTFLLDPAAASEL